MTSARLPKAPEGLTPATAEWWLSVAQEWDLERHHLRLLTLAAQAWDEVQAAQAVIATRGAVYEDRWGQPKARPEVALVRDGRIAFARLVRELDLDGVPPPESRPPALPSNRPGPGGG